VTSLAGIISFTTVNEEVIEATNYNIINENILTLQSVFISMITSLVGVRQHITLNEEYIDAIKLIFFDDDLIYGTNIYTY
jgi:hypothetical protein